MYVETYVEIEASNLFRTCHLKEEKSWMLNKTLDLMILLKPNDTICFDVWNMTCISLSEVYLNGCQCTLGDGLSMGK